MTASLQDDLAGLTGEEIYHLVNELDKAIGQADNARRAHNACDLGACPATDMVIEFLSCKLDALAQFARITIPIREAAAIIYRVRYSRNHPVRVPGT